MRLSLLIGTLLSLLTAGASAAEPEPLKIGISSASVTIFSLWMAEEAGLFQQRGLEVEILNMEGGSPGLLALLSGDLQAMGVGLSPVIRASRQGASVKMIASFANTIPFALFGAPGVTSGAQLKDATVGVSSFGSESDIALDLSLRQLGINRSEVTVVRLGGTPQRLAGLFSGQVKATPLLEPSSSIARAQGLKPLVDLVAAKVPWAFDELWVSEAYLKSHRDTLAKLVGAIIEATDLARAEPARAKQVMASVFHLDKPEIVDATYAEWRRVMPDNAEPSAEAAANVIAQLAAMQVDTGGKSAADFIDSSSIEMLKQNGTIAALRQRYHAQ